MLAKREIYFLTISKDRLIIDEQLSGNALVNRLPVSK